MAFWREDDPEIQEVNGRLIVVKGGMFDHQREWWQLPNFVRMLVGGFGSGKSEILSKWMIASCLHNAPVWSAIVSPSFPQARRTIIPTITRLLEGKQALRKDMTFRHNKSDHCFYIEFECRPPATLLYLSGEDPDSLKGPNLGTVGLDEPFLQEKQVFEVMSSRCRDPQAKLIAMGLAGTPEQLNWGFDLAEGEMRERYDVGLVVADTNKNRALPKAYRERLIKGLDPKAADAFVRAKFVNLSAGRVFYGFEKERNIKVKQAPPGANWFAGMDFNVNPMAFCVGWSLGETAHIVAEFEIPNSDTQSACAEIKAAFPQVRLVFPDPTGKRRQTNAPGGISDFHWIQRAGYIVMAPIEPWGRRDSFNSCNLMYSSGRLTVDPACKKLIRYLQDHTHELMTRQEHMTHLLDSHRYPITYLFPAYRKHSSTVAVTGG